MKLHKVHFSKKRIIVLAVLAVVVAGGVYSFSRAGAAAKENAIPTVQATTLKKTSLQDSVSVSGTIASGTSQNVYTTLSLPVKTVGVKVGDKVKKGDVLATLDTGTLSKDIESAQYSTKDAEDSARISLQKAQADYSNALQQYNSNQNSELVSVKSAVTDAQQNLDTAKTSYSYNQYLYNSGELSKMLLDQEKTKLDAAQNAYDKAKSMLASTQNKVTQDLKTLKNAVDLAQAKYSDKSQNVMLEKQQQNMKDAIITAPSDGTVTALSASVGAMPAGVLFTLEDTQDLIVKTEIKEFDVAKVTVGKKVTVKTDATGNTETVGEVTRVSPAATASTQGTNNVTYAAEIKIPNPGPELKIGMKARLNIILTEHSDIYTVPYDAVQRKADGSAFVFAAVKDGAGYKAKEIPVQTGLENDVSIEISGSDIKDGVQIVNDAENISAGSALKL